MPFLSVSLPVSYSYFLHSFPCLLLFLWATVLVCMPFLWSCQLQFLFACLSCLLLFLSATVLVCMPSPVCSCSCEIQFFAFPPVCFWSCQLQFLLACLSCLLLFLSDRNVPGSWLLFGYPSFFYRQPLLSATIPLYKYISCYLSVDTRFHPSPAHHLFMSFPFCIIQCLFFPFKTHSQMFNNPINIQYMEGWETNRRTKASFLFSIILLG